MKRCFTSCGVFPQSAQKVEGNILLDSALVGVYNVRILVKQTSCVPPLVRSFSELLNGEEDHRTIGSKRHSLQAVELSQQTQAAVQIVSNLPAPSNGGQIYRFLGMPAMRTRWMAGAVAHKSG